MQTDSPDKLPDDLLVENYRATGDSTFFAEVFRRHGRAVYGCCMAMVQEREAAADLTQETFLRAMEGIGGFSGGNLRAWLVTIGRHLAINHIRKKNRGPRALEEPDDRGDGSAAAQNMESRERLRQLLEPLSSEQQLCLKLFYGNGLSYDEISEVTGMAIGTVRSHLQNGRRRMRRSEADVERS
jgi:RNA polymerase sigma-70 factor (ECF subfamily)